MVTHLGVIFTFSPLNPSHPDISMRILHTVLNRFPRVLKRRICSVIKTFFFLVDDHFPYSCDRGELFIDDIVRKN